MKGIIRSFTVAVWFMFLTFPLLAIKVIPSTQQVLWRFENTAYIGVGVFFISFVWRALLVKKGITTAADADLVWLFSLLASARKALLSPQRVALAGAALFLVIGLVPLVWAVAGGNDISYFSWAFFAGALGAALAFVLTKSKEGAVLAYFTICCGALLYRTIMDDPTCPWMSILSFIFGFGVLLYAALAGKKAAFENLSQPGKGRSCLFFLVFVWLVLLVFVIDTYRVNILISTFIWIMLGLGLNIVVGQAGMLVLGYVAFYAVGAYTYAVGNQLFGNEFVGFWLFLPLGGFMAALAGILLSLPIMRLKGDYLAIVTLGFGEIVRVVLEGGSLSLAPVADLLRGLTGLELPEWFSTPLELGGPAGIAAIPPPTVFGVSMDLDQSAKFLYLVALVLAILTVFAVSRLRDSRLGRSWMALRDDEIACEAMGINKVTTKLSAFALGACWAGFGGVLFAAKTSFINPSSFTFMESALILSVIVLGGLGSILGVVLGACILILLPEYLRSFDEYRMLIFGASMVIMMVFRPQGLITPRPKHRTIRKTSAGGSAVSPSGGSANTGATLAGGAA